MNKKILYKKTRTSLNVKFIYSEKATKFCEIFTLRLSYVVPVKSKVEISRNFVTFSEYMNNSNNISCSIYGSKYQSNFYPGQWKICVLKSFKISCILFMLDQGLASIQKKAKVFHTSVKVCLNLGMDWFFGVHMQL